MGIGLCLLAIGVGTMSSLEAHETGVGIENDTTPTPRQLRRSLFERKAVLVVYGATDKALAEQYRTILQELSKSPESDSWRNVSISFKNASEVDETELKEHILFLVGTFEAIPILNDFSRNIPVKFHKAGFAFDTKEYTSQDMNLSVGFYPNPQNDTLPISFLSGNDEKNVFEHFQKRVREDGRSFFRQNMDYEIYKGNSRTVMGDFNPKWGIDRFNYFDFSDGNTLVHTSEHFDFISHRNATTLPEMTPVAGKIEQTRTAIVNFLRSTESLPKFSYHIYKSSEEKGLITGNTDQAHFDTLDNSVHTIINEAYADNFLEKENALLIHLLLGTSKTKALERGLPIYFTNQWQWDGYRYWSARLFESGNTLALKELFDNELLAVESPLISDCLSATLVAFLLDTWGKQTFLQQYPVWKPTESEIQKLEPAWQDYLAKNASEHVKKERNESRLPYLKGFNFAHEGYSIYNGYTGGRATKALEKMKFLGSNAMALVPYSFMRDKNSPMPFRFSNNAGSENDAGLVHSAFEAKKLGMCTVLKPQIFAGDSWPGDVEMLNEKDWEAFFDYYYRWIRHYAFLAEIHQIEALCVGVEFSKATLSREDDWRKMFKGLRGLYHGKLTYAANWGAEFEQIGFWDELDFIGLNCYYPLSKNDTPTKNELKANFDSIKTKIAKVYDKFKKPIVFTEIGFRSINAPWKNPHAEGDDSFNAEHQQLCYEVIFEGIENATWCAGILWWKFPSYLEYRGKENSAFTPNNKRAEETVREWFFK